MPWATSFLIRLQTHARTIYEIYPPPPIIKIIWMLIWTLPSLSFPLFFRQQATIPARLDDFQRPTQTVDRKMTTDGAQAARAGPRAELKWTRDQSIDLIALSPSYTHPPLLKTNNQTASKPRRLQLYHTSCMCPGSLCAIWFDIAAIPMSSHIYILYHHNSTR